MNAREISTGVLDGVTLALLSPSKIATIDTQPCDEASELFLTVYDVQSTTLEPIELISVRFRDNSPTKIDILIKSDGEIFAFVAAEVSYYDTYFN